MTVVVVVVMMMAASEDGFRQCMPEKEEVGYPDAYGRVECQSENVELG